MPKVVIDRATDIAKSVLWAAMSRVGIPVLLALVLTGIPAHLLWAGRVNEDLVVAKNDILSVREDVRSIKTAASVAQKSESEMQAKMASMQSDVAAILRAMNRIESQLDIALQRSR